MAANSYGARNVMYKYVATLSEIPFHVLVVYTSLYCSGTLVRSKIVITVASCLLTDKIRRPIVKLGAHSMTGHGQIIPVIDIKIHEYFRYMNRIDNDIAMLVLKMDVIFSEHVKKAIIVEPEIALRPGVTIEVSGWGSTNLPQSFVNQLIWSQMVVLENEECEEDYKHLMSRSNYCASYQPDRRLSDSGGPAIYNKELLVGILSYGGTSHEEPHIAIFTNISYFHRWIILNTKRYLEKYCVERNDTEYFLASSEKSDKS